MEVGLGVVSNYPKNKSNNYELRIIGIYTMPSLSILLIMQ